MTDIDRGMLAAAAAAYPGRDGTDGRRTEQLAAVEAEMNRIAKALLRKQQDPFALYSPLASQDRFHRSKSYICMFSGGNRAGKTTTGVVEVARAVMGRDPYGKYAANNGVVLIVCRNLEHFGAVVAKKLLRAAAFQILFDRREGHIAWRAVRPNDPYDAARKREWKWAPPLLPASAVEVAWKDKKAGVPYRVLIKATNWEIYFYSEATLPQGMAADIAWIDEEADNPKAIDELQARLIDRHGRLLLTATPEHGSAEFYQLWMRGQAEDNDPELLHVITASTGDNEFIAEADKQRFRAGLLSERAVEAKFLGRPIIGQRQVYPEFDPNGVHGCPPCAIPEQWCRYLVLDPGTADTVLLFFAVPPPEEGQADHIYLYRELHLKRHTAQQTAAKLFEVANAECFEAFIIDWHGSRITREDGMTVEAHYANAFRECGIQSRQTGHGFLLGCDNVLVREEAVRRWLMIRSARQGHANSGTATLRVVRGVAPNLVAEMPLQLYEKTRADKRQDVRRSHSVDCLEYAAAHGLPYRKPAAIPFKETWLGKVFARKERHRAEMAEGKTARRFAPASGR